MNTTRYYRGAWASGDRHASCQPRSRAVERQQAPPGRLPRQEQDVIVLCVLVELSYEETAEALWLPLGTLDARIASQR